jgi:ribonuclease HIII
MQKMLRQHGLSEAYINSTTAALIGSRAIVLSAISNSSSGAEFKIPAGVSPGRSAAAAALRPKSALKTGSKLKQRNEEVSPQEKQKRQFNRMFSHRMKREVRVARYSA